MTPEAALQLADWRRRVSDMYATVRATGVPKDAWELWRATREELFLNHPQTPLPAEQRTPEHAPQYFPYDPALRVLADVRPAHISSVQLPVSNPGEFAATRVGTVAGLLGQHPFELALFWLAGYAGGLLLAFRDATSGQETYGAGRYLLDTAKGADLGDDAGRLVLDFNFAYQPSCSYDPAWSCPLAPRENWLSAPVRAGERLAAT